MEEIGTKTISYYRTGGRPTISPDWSETKFSEIKPNANQSQQRLLKFLFSHFVNYVIKELKMKKAIRTVMLKIKPKMLQV